MAYIPESVRAQVRQRAQNNCEYCFKPEQTSAYPHHVEHIIALKHDGSSELDNLAWSCFQCNVAKGTDVASIDRETGEFTPFFNPRTQNWDDHFLVQPDAVIIGTTPIGRVTVRLLQVNHPERVETRLQLIEADMWR